MKNINFQELEKVLISLYGKINTIEELEKHRGTKFNIFTILGMERKEVGTHSYFIYELINPKGSHYQGSKYLEIFIKKVLELPDFDLKNVKVGRETLIPSGRSIDFTIENDTHYIAIEMKIDAKDQNKQLYDYHKFAKKQNKIPKVYYLSLDGKDASDSSTFGENNVDYEKISFENHILDFIECSLEKSVELSVIRESLIQYKHLIKKITNQSSQEIQMEIVQIVDNPKIAQAATEMSKNLKYVWALKEVEFWKELAQKLNVELERKKLNHKGWSEVLFHEVFCNENDEVIESNEAIAHEIASLRKTNDISFFIEKKELQFQIYMRRDDSLSFQIYGLSNDKINTIDEETGISSKNGNDARWINSKHKISFSIEYDEPAYDIFNHEKLKTIVDNVCEETIYYIQMIEEKCNYLL